MLTGVGVLGHEGARLLADLADVTGLAAAFSDALAPLRVRRGGHDPGRVAADVAVMAVRAFYFGLQAWAAHEPERWARWAAPCPVRAGDTRGGGADRRRIHDRMAAGHGWVSRSYRCS